MLKTGLRLIGVYATIESVALIGFNGHRLAEWNSDAGTLELAKNAAEAATYLVTAMILLGVIPAFVLTTNAERVARWLQRGSNERQCNPTGDRLFSDGLMLLALYFLVSGTAKTFGGGLQVIADLLREDVPRWFPYSLPQLLDGLVRVGGGGWLYLRARKVGGADAPHNQPMQTDEP